MHNGFLFITFAFTDISAEFCGCAVNAPKSDGAMEVTMQGLATCSQKQGFSFLQRFFAGHSSATGVSSYRVDKFWSTFNSTMNYSDEHSLEPVASMISIEQHGLEDNMAHTKEEFGFVRHEVGRRLSQNCSGRKLIINSHVEYEIPLQHLVASLKQYKFKRFEDIVVFRGGAESDSNPYIGTDGMTFVDLRVNSYDLNSMMGLAKYKNHSAICAEAYFYIHDTATVGPCFPQVFDEIEVAPTEVITPGAAYFSNQCVFGGSLVDNFGQDFDKNISKAEGFQIEAGGCANGACALHHYAEKQTLIPERQTLGNADLYSTGIPRVCSWYKDFDIYKCFLYQGDMSGNFVKDFGDRTNEQLFLVESVVKQPHWAQTCIRNQILKAT